MIAEVKEEKKVLAHLVAANDKITSEKQVPGFIPGWHALQDGTGPWENMFWFTGEFEKTTPYTFRLPLTCEN